MRLIKKSPAAGNAVAATPAPTSSPTPVLDELLKAEPDLLDRIFDYAVKLMPELAGKKEQIKRALRDEFAGERVYIKKRGADAPDTVAKQVLGVFNGRNASEVARELGIGRATVYRKIKQAGPRR